MKKLWMWSGVIGLLIGGSAMSQAVPLDYNPLRERMLQRAVTQATIQQVAQQARRYLSMLALAPDRDTAQQLYHLLVTFGQQMREFFFFHGDARSCDRTLLGLYMRELRSLALRLADSFDAVDSRLKTARTHAGWGEYEEYEVTLEILSELHAIVEEEIARYEQSILALARLGRQA